MNNTKDLYRAFLQIIGATASSKFDPNLFNDAYLGAVLDTVGKNQGELMGIHLNTTGGLQEIRRALSIFAPEVGKSLLMVKWREQCFLGIGIDRSESVILMVRCVNPSNVEACLVRGGAEVEDSKISPWPGLESMLRSKLKVCSPNSDKQFIICLLNQANYEIPTLC